MTQGHTAVNEITSLPSFQPALVAKSFLVPQNFSIYL